MRTSLLISIVASIALPAFCQDAKVEISLSANGSTAGTLYKGWPLILHAVALLDEGDQAALGMADAPWTAALSLRITNAAGAPQTWPLEMVWSAAEPVLLKPLGEAAVFWALPPEATSGLPVGEYTVSLTLDTRRSAADWSWVGQCRSEQVSLKVAAEPASLEAKQEAFKALVRARYHQLRDEPDTALSILDEWLARNPEDSAALGEKAALLEQSGRLAEALAAYTSAIDAFNKRFPDAIHPPRELMRNRSRLFNTLIQQQQ